MASFDLDPTRAAAIAQLLVSLADMADQPDGTPEALADLQLKSLTYPATAGWKGRRDFATKRRADAASIVGQVDIDPIRAAAIVQLLVCLDDMANLVEGTPRLTDRQLESLTPQATIGWLGQEEFFQQFRADASSLARQLPPEAPAIHYR